MKFVYLVTPIAALSLSACGTPQEVRNLSTAQLEAFNNSVADRRETNQAFIAYVNAVNSQKVADMQAVYAETESGVIEQLSAVETGQERRELIRGLQEERGKTDTEVQEIMDEQARFVRTLNSHLAYLEAMSAAQHQLHTQIMTDDPLTRLLKRIVGVEEYNTYEARLNQLRLMVEQSPSLPTPPAGESE